MARPYFKGMTDQELVDAYWAARQSQASWSDMATIGGFTRSGRGKIAAGVFRASDDIDLIVAIARKRGINVLTFGRTPAEV